MQAANDERVIGYSCIQILTAALTFTVVALTATPAVCEENDTVEEMSGVFEEYRGALVNNLRRVYRLLMLHRSCRERAGEGFEAVS